MDQTLRQFAFYQLIDQPAIQNISQLVSPSLNYSSFGQSVFSQLIQPIENISQPVSQSVNQSPGQSVDVLPVNWSTNKNISNQVSPSVNDTAGQI